MSRRRELQRHRRTLGEVNDIMDSMRMLSVLETRRLAKFIDCQRLVVDGIRDAAADFLSSYSLSPPAVSDCQRLYLAIGSERGFCGDFNASIRESLQRLLARPEGRDAAVIAVGRKLAADLDDLGDRLIPMEGATTADDVPLLLQSLVALLEARTAQSGGFGLTALHHGEPLGKVLETAILPAFADIELSARPCANRLRLYLTPESFFSGLVEQYLFAQLHELAFTSLFHEHQHRVRHLEGATQRLEETLSELDRRQSILRQEEITEELEVILLGAELGDPGSE